MERSCRPGRCFLYPFYIKPQRLDEVHILAEVVSCIRSTSNHNFMVIILILMMLFPVSVLHQTTTNCNQTSRRHKLFPVSVLHQTTTSARYLWFFSLLFPVSVLHQTTTLARKAGIEKGCFLYPFYIKPQLDSVQDLVKYVVSCIRSTSNHNSRSLIFLIPCVVSCIRSTSNHNLCL